MCRSYASSHQSAPADRTTLCANIARLTVAALLMRPWENNGTQGCCSDVSYPLLSTLRVHLQRMQTWEVDCAQKITHTTDHFWTKRLLSCVQMICAPKRRKLAGWRTGRYCMTWKPCASITYNNHFTMIVQWVACRSNFRGENGIFSDKYPQF